MNTKRHNAITNVLVVLALAAVAAGGWFFIKDRVRNFTSPQNCSQSVAFDYFAYGELAEAKADSDAIIVAHAVDLADSGFGADDLLRTTVNTHVQEVLWTKDGLGAPPAAGSPIKVTQYANSVCSNELTYSRMVAGKDYVLFLSYSHDVTASWFMPLGGQGTFLINQIDDDPQISSPQHVYPEVFGEDFSTTVSLTDFVSAIKDAK
ncbi:hypothetical protein [Timonella senegalensis]|uniref:hypothetical protein n=1 Tax=Timonella senegalensis TaxID=1465825 RepID=UPI0002F281C3|nr:hypothetical protein [Timonella senegalensis]